MTTDDRESAPSACAVSTSSSSTVTVIFERNLGNKRLVPFLFALFNGVLFFVFVWMLHTRDKKVWEMRENWDPSKAIEAG